MADITSELPIRSQIDGQVNWNDIIVKLGDATNPATQQAAVDVNGSQFAVLKDSLGNLIGDQNLLASYWLQSVAPSNGPASPGTAATYSNLSGGIYNSTPPTLTNGQQAALQLDSSGQLIVASAPLSDISPAPQTITAPDTTSAMTSGANGQPIWTGTPDAGSAATFIFATLTSIRVQVNGTWTGTLQSEISMDGGTTWYQDVLFQDGIPGVQSDFSANFEGITNVSATVQYRIRALNVAWTGTATVQIIESTNDSMVYVGNALRLVDRSSNNQSTIKAPSTRAVAADTSLVVALSPNSPLVNFPDLVDTNYGPVSSSTIRTAAQIGNATGAADFNNGLPGVQTLRVAAQLAVAGADVSSTNPVPVALSNAPLGTPVNNYNTATVAKNASSNHIYAITAAKTFQGKKIWASASGLMKVEVRVSPDGSTYTSLWVGFNSTANPNITVDMDQMVFLESGTGSTIEVIRTNLDNGTQSVYSTISGTEV